MAIEKIITKVENTNIDLNKDIKCYYPNMNIKVKLPIGYKIGGIKNE